MSNHAALIRTENEGLTVTRRGRRFVEFALPDSKTRHVATIEPLHTRTTSEEIDTEWIASIDPAWQWQLRKTDFQAHARNPFNTGDLIRWTHESGEWVIVDPQSINWINQDGSREQIAIKQAVSGTPNDCTLRFNNAYGTGRHFEYIAHPKRLIKHFILDQALPNPAVWLTGTIWFEVEFVIKNSAGVELYLDGVEWARTNKVKVQTSSRIEFRSLATGEVLWYADAPVATDADGETVASQYEVENQSGTYFIRVRVPRTWLLSAAYPVIVDPTFTDGYGGDVDSAYDVRTLGSVPDTAYGDVTNLYIRNILGFGHNFSTDPYYFATSLLLFNLSSLEGSTIDSATLTLYRYDNNTNWSDGYIQARRILSANANWTEGSTWNYCVPTSQRWAGDTSSDGGEDAGCGRAGTDFSNDALASYSYPANSDATGTAYAISLDTDYFADLVAANYGIVLYQTVNDEPIIMCSSDHATTGYRPKLVVEYTSGVSESASPSATPSPSRSASASASASPSRSPSPSSSSSRSASASASASAAPVIEGTTCWGHETTATEDNVRTFSGNWSGTGTISGTGDAETICLEPGEYMEGEVVYTGERTVELDMNHYGASDLGDIVMSYRTGASVALCQAAAWTEYTVPFVSSGYVQVRLERPA